jgi:UDP-N-acetylglucosamine 1-carboxyvinyltransferase
VPIEFLEIELATLEEMGFRYDLSEEYLARNERTRLVDITTRQGLLHAPLDKIHPMPFPGLNIDNLPFFAVIAATAEGRPCCTTGSTRTVPSTSSSSTSSAATSSCSTRTG